MDLGTSTFTDFKMDESVVGYIAENIDLFGCDTGLVHSHHSMGAFFSGTDTSTLRAEGNDTNCFVSLIVDTKGTYQAAVTRRVQAKKEIITKYLDTSYEFFGEGTKYMGDHSTVEKQTFGDDTIIEYFMLDVEIEHVDNPLAYLDSRFDEIQEKKCKAVNLSINNPISTVTQARTPYEDFTFQDYLNKKREVEEPTLFSEEEMNDMIDVSDWEPDLDTIHKLVCQMVTCTLILDIKKFDLKQYITRWIDKKYEEIFGLDSTLFNEWTEFIVEFQMDRYRDLHDIPEEDIDLLYHKLAMAIYQELYPYSGNKYIDTYIEVLNRYIYE